MTVLGVLETIAHLIAVKGNIDRGDLAKGLPDCHVVEVGSTRIYVVLLLLRHISEAEGFKKGSITQKITSSSSAS
jgi:predicted phosphodiesterase